MAAEVFAEKGFDAGTTKEIATRIGLSQPSIYYYFGSKEGLLKEIMLAVVNDLTAALRQARSNGASSRDVLAQVIEQMTLVVAKQRVPFTVYYKEFGRIDVEIRRALQDTEREFVAEVRGIVQEVQRDGGLPAELSPMVLTEAILGMVSWTHRWFRPDGPLEARDIARHFTALIGIPG
ncbi:TetR/AcrR family transcriptional regulator [Pseudonocardia nigra]|uniref:TetR/AcrR family transcriptional regulator n=1 Tax=Pseudonocardia nigra TaxID=1921578 RepID=UPI001C5EC2EA|nr:TetR/AcrR family transcriptional regulator [Pseudonocardia nigra]